MRRALLIGLAVLASCSDEMEPDTAKDVAHVAGDVNNASDDFHVEGRWVVRARVSGDDFVSVEVVRSRSDRPKEMLTFRSGVRSAVRRGDCDCYVDITAYGNRYDVTVTDLPG